MSRRNHRYTEAFKKDAVKLVLSGKKSVVDTARDLGVNESTLHTWKSTYQSEVLGEVLPEVSLEEELVLLKKENQRLKEERDLLKKAAIFFANPKK